MATQADSADYLTGYRRLILDPRLPKPKLDLCALAVMTKAPLPGISKTRLIPPLAPLEAAELSACFLRDTAASVAAISAECGAESIAAYTPVGWESEFEGLLPKTFKLLAQRGQSFGERLFNAAEDVLSVGYESVCLINSDSPTLPRALLRSAVSALARDGDRVVLGAAADGGYYLIGFKHAHPHLFSGIDWSTSNVLTQTMKRAAELKLEIEILPTWYDVDDPDSLRQLCDELFARNGERALQSGAVADSAPHTRGYLSRLIETDSGRQRIWGIAGKTNKSRRNDQLP